MTTTISGTTGITTNSLTATGNPAVTFSNSATLGAGNTTGFKNRIINGAMVIDQRNAGASQAVTTTGAYTVDRFFVQPTGASITTQRVAGTSGYQYALRLTGAASITQCYVQQKIEQLNSYDLAGQTVTVSFTASSSTLTSLTCYVEYATAGADNWSTFATSTTQAITINSTATRYSFQSTLSASATNGIRFIFSTGAFTSGTLDITGVQLEVGSSATSFDVRDYGRELILCQRYFVKTYGQSVAVPTNSSSGFVRTRSYSGAYGAFVWLLPVSMRTAPTASIYNYSTSAVNSWWNTDASNSVAAAVSTTGEQNITVESSALTANQTYTFHLTGSAEL
jgi:hypothetical protein